MIEGDELAQLIKEGQTMWPEGDNRRILTDLSGPFFTVVAESEWDSIGAWEANGQVIFGDARFPACFERMAALVRARARVLNNSRVAPGKVLRRPPGCATR
jgi:hypothetical protein